MSKRTLPRIPFSTRTIGVAAGVTIAVTASALVAAGAHGDSEPTAAGGTAQAGRPADVQENPERSSTTDPTRVATSTTLIERVAGAADLTTARRPRPTTVPSTEPVDAAPAEPSPTSTTSTTAPSDASTTTTVAPERTPTTTQVPVAPAVTTAPADPEGPAGPTAGQVSQHGAGARPPAAPIPAPTWDRVDLDLPPTEGDIFLTTEPDPIAVSPLLNGSPGGLVGNASGCQLNCITSALLRTATTNPSVGFELRTTVPVSASAWVTTTAPAIHDGLPVMGAWPDYSHHGGTSWETTLGSLQFGTDYHFTLLVVDEDGHEKWATTQFTTIDGIGGLAGNGDECYYQCIEDAYLIGTPGHDTADIFVKTSAIAEIEVVVSTSEPGWIGVNPVLPPDRPFEVTESNSWAMRGTASELEPETVYHVLITATDGDGFSAHAIGSFSTDSAPPPPSEVLISFSRFHVIGDGDDGSLDKGEISFTWGIEGWNYVGERDEDKIASNTTIQLPQGSGRWISVPHGELLPRLAGNAAERDWQDHEHGDRQACKRYSPGPALDFAPFSVEDCNTRTNVAVIERQPLSWIDSLPSCSEFGYTDYRQDHRCAIVQSPNMGGEFVSFDMVVALHVGTP